MARKPKETTHLRVRIESALLARLEKVREKTGRTLTGEIVHRIEQTFRKEEDADLGSAFLGGDDTAKSLGLLATAMRLVTAEGDGTPWSKDQTKAEAVQAAAPLLIAGSAGLPVVSSTFGVTDLGSERGRKLAKSILEISNLSLPGEGEKK
jgi:hypothetical protein